MLRPGRARSLMLSGMLALLFLGAAARRAQQAPATGEVRFEMEINPVANEKTQMKIGLQPGADPQPGSARKQRRNAGDPANARRVPPFRTLLTRMSRSGSNQL